MNERFYTWGTPRGWIVIDNNSILSFECLIIYKPIPHSLTWVEEDSILIYFAFKAYSSSRSYAKITMHLINDFPIELFSFMNERSKEWHFEFCEWTKPNANTAQRNNNDAAQQV